MAAILTVFALCLAAAAANELCLSESGEGRKASALVQSKAIPGPRPIDVLAQKEPPKPVQLLSGKSAVAAIAGISGISMPSSIPMPAVSMPAVSMPAVSTPTRGNVTRSTAPPVSSLAAANASSLAAANASTSQNQATVQRAEVKSEVKIELSAEEIARLKKVGTGLRAAFSEDGYQQVSELHNNTEMEGFVRRTVHHLGLVITTMGALPGFVPYYSGEKAVQSYNRMVEELFEQANQATGWVSYKTPGLMA